jgi:murein DD-endopeptidase MepM/ murein hydrolase activator NlpD
MPGCKRTPAARILAPLTCVLGVAALAVAAGCSSDVTRFDLVGLDFFGTAPGARPAPSPVGYAPATYGPPGYAPPGSAPARRSFYPGANGNGLQESSLPPVSSSGQDYYRPPGRGYPSASARPPYPPPRPERTADLGSPPWTDRSPASWTDGSRPPWTDRSPPPWTDKEPFPWPESPTSRQSLSPTEAPQGWEGRHTLQSGESLHAIARRHKVSVDELKRANGITDGSKVWAGKVLAVPGRAGAAATAAPANAPPRVVQVTPRVVAAPPPEPETLPESPQRSAARTTVGAGSTMTDAAPTPASAAAKFRWPARGRIIVGFGAEQPDGTKSEGINLAVPLGTDVHAAEAGRVHYAGDGLKGYGNLILIRHANGWVSAYAHTDQMLVKAGDDVRRGQVIGKAGKTGPVAQPQLRFELRKGSQPVDPLPHLAN